MYKLSLSLDFGEDTHCSFTEVTTEPLAKVEVQIARSMYLLDIVKSRHFSYNAEHVYLDLSKCNRNFTIQFFMKQLQASPSEVKLCLEKKMSLLIPLIKLLQIDKTFC
jgi:spore coat polysaccharide biosynthesis protein SpsF (cytidylyltransferase family)